MNREDKLNYGGYDPYIYTQAKKGSYENKRKRNKKHK